ncbi:hypothetical protein PLICRDRAFT_29231 [Plicaturopsis crispa FD-325 SS-3]|nr:hypothetical protein PLICRDRAFT_29231 [Plicaturopsis crispa FD-325 SS-3]
MAEGPLNVEESRAKRLERQQSRFRDRGGIFVPSGKNTLVDVLLARTATGLSPDKVNDKPGESAASPLKGKGKRKAGEDAGVDGAKKKKGRATKNPKKAAKSTTVEDDGGADPGPSKPTAKRATARKAKSKTAVSGKSTKAKSSLPPPDEPEPDAEAKPIPKSKKRRILEVEDAPDQVAKAKVVKRVKTTGTSSSKKDYQAPTAEEEIHVDAPTKSKARGRPKADKSNPPPTDVAKENALPPDPKPSQSRSAPSKRPSKKATDDEQRELQDDGPSRSKPKAGKPSGQEKSRRAPKETAKDSSHNEDPPARSTKRPRDHTSDIVTAEPEDTAPLRKRPKTKPTEVDDPKKSRKTVKAISTDPPVPLSKNLKENANVAAVGSAPGKAKAQCKPLPGRPARRGPPKHVLQRIHVTTGSSPLAAPLVPDSDPDEIDFLS